MAQPPVIYSCEWARNRDKATPRTASTATEPDALCITSSARGNQ